MESLQDIFTWARLKGNIDYSPSQSGTLLAAVGADEDTTIDELAAISTERFFHAADANWMRSESNDPDDSKSTDLIVKPAEITIGRAMSAHHVARLWSGVESSRAAKARRTQYDDSKAQNYRDAKLIALQATATANGQARPSNVGGETVPINEVADTTQKREIPVMNAETYRTLYRNYKKWAHVDPKPSITPTRQQLSVLQVILLTGSCYVDMALWGNFQGRSARAMRCEGMIPGPERSPHPSGL